jgi:hypothetical protein
VFCSPLAMRGGRRLLSRLNSIATELLAVPNDVITMLGCKMLVIYNTEATYMQEGQWWLAYWLGQQFCDLVIIDLPFL